MVQVAPAAGVLAYPRALALTREAIERAYPDAAGVRDLPADRTVDGAGLDNWWRQAELATADPLVGLTSAAAVAPGTAGLAEYLFGSGPSLKRAIHSAARMINLYVRGVDVLLTQDEVATVSLVSVRPLCDQAVCFMLGLFAEWGRRAFGTLALAEVVVKHDPRDRDAYRRAFDAPVVVGAANALVFARQQLECRPAGADEDTWAALVAHGESQRQAAPGDDDIDRAYARCDGPDGWSADAVAASLGIHRRTLQRRLHERGATHLAQVDRTRRERALRDLNRYRGRLADLARELGFSGVRAFARAFRRWTGETPSEYLRTAGH